MKKLILLFFSLITLFGCAAPKKVKLIFYKEYKSDSVSPFIKSSYNSIYIVENYCDNIRCQALIDSLAIDIGNSKKYDQYLLQIYKASSHTNLKNLSKNPRDLDRYSDLHDHIINYEWYNKKFIAKHKIKNGQYEERDANVILSPPSK